MSEKKTIYNKYNKESEKKNYVIITAKKYVLYCIIKLGFCNLRENYFQLNLNGTFLFIKHKIW